MSIQITDLSSPHNIPETSNIYILNKRPENEKLSTITNRNKVITIRYDDKDYTVIECFDSAKITDINSIIEGNLDNLPYFNIDKGNATKIIIPNQIDIVKPDNIVESGVAPTDVESVAAPTYVESVAAPANVESGAAPTNFESGAAPTNFESGAAPTNFESGAAPYDVVSVAAPSDVVSEAAPADVVSGSAPADVVSGAAPADVVSGAAAKGGNSWINKIFGGSKKKYRRKNNRKTRKKTKNYR
jgi:hypothetical protein